MVARAERTGKLAIEQAYVTALPKTLTRDPVASRLRHIKLWYCLLQDDVLPVFAATHHQPSATPKQPSTTGSPGPRHQRGHHAATNSGIGTAGEGHDRASGGCAPASEVHSRTAGFGVALRSLHLGSNMLTRVPTRPPHLDKSH